MKINLFFLPKILLFVILGFWLTACNQGGNVQEKVAAAHKRHDGPAIWKVTDRDSTLYLFGAVHLLPDGADWQRRDLQAAFDEVGTVFFEIPDDEKSKLEASLLQRQYGLYGSGERLSDHLDSLAQKRLTAAAYNVDLPPAQIELFKPWLVADMLTIAAAQEAGLNSENSADTVMRAKAKQARKSIKSLDSMRTYIEAVALQPDWVQIQSLEDTIINFDTLAAEIKTVNAAWIIGNTDRLEAALIEPARARSPEMFATLFTARNIKWATTLDRFLQGDDNAMVVVGIGHLLGDDGLPAQLRELGYEVERVRRFDLPN